MRIVLVAIGWENIALQALSAMLKKHGHECHLVYDQSLFDDKNYLCIKPLWRLFEQRDLVYQRIVELEPDLLCFHVQTVQYQEMRDLAARVKEVYRVPVVFGGIHAHSAPEDVLLSDDPAVDDASNLAWLTGSLRPVGGRPRSVSRNWANSRARTYFPRPFSLRKV